MEAPGVDGYAAFKIADGVTSFSGYGMGSYSFFNKANNGGANIFAAHAFEVPTTLPAGSLHDLLTIFLDKNNGTGGIQHVVNDSGGSSPAPQPGTPGSGGRQPRGALALPPGFKQEKNCPRGAP